MVLSREATWDFVGISWSLCSDPVVSLGIENAAHNAIASGWILCYKKRSTPAAYNREIYSVIWSTYQRWLSTKFTHTLDDSAAMFSVVIRLVPVQFVAVLFMLICFRGVWSRFMLLHCFEGRHIIWYNFHLLPVFNKYVPALGWLLLYLLRVCSFISHGCQHKFAHRMDSVAKFSVVIWLVPSTL